jgi:DNA polymerase V
VSAGFPSPAADYENESLNINLYLVRNPPATFHFPVEGNPMDPWCGKYLPIPARQGP